MKIKFLELTPLAKLFPPIPAKKLIPEWYKEMGPTVAGVQKIGFGTPEIQKIGFGTNLSVKRCIPVLDFITSGYLIRTHTDIFVKRWWTEERGEEISLDFKLAEHPSPVSFHDTGQMPLIRNGHNKKIAKFNGIWGIETPTGYSCLFVHPEYISQQKFRIFPAIVDTDQYTDPIGFPFMFEDSFEKEEFIIEAGTPIAHVIPFRRESWNHTIEPVEKYSRTNILMKTIWEGAYRKFMHTKKSFE